MNNESPNNRGLEDLNSEMIIEDLQLPILKYSQEIKETANDSETLIVVGETGSGKTTELPLMLRELIEPGEKIAITQPRRVAARSVAKHVATKLGCNVGEEVGYTVRFDDKTTEGTQINFMTDGILIRKLQSDPLLMEYSIVMVDEVHERSINIDFTLGLLKRLQANRVQAGLKPLKIVVTSATLEKQKLSQYFDGSPIVEVPGRLYPVDVYYEEKPIYDYTQSATERVSSIIQAGKVGDILIFMPGVEEINRTIEQIQRLGISDLTILPLHGQLSPEDQDRIFDKNDKRRKVIISTNVAETSITVPGVKYVIDSGFVKQIEFNPHTGIESLVTTPNSKSSAVQRAGRAGRVEAGECYRLYT